MAIQPEKAKEGTQRVKKGKTQLFPMYGTIEVVVKALVPDQIWHMHMRDSEDPRAKLAIVTAKEVAAYGHWLKQWFKEHGPCLVTVFAYDFTIDEGNGSGGDPVIFQIQKL